MENRFYKVSESGGSFVTGIFFNPVTGEHKTEVLRDYDYADCRNDNDELYYMPIDEEARRAYMHHKGVILEGDKAEVIKGRTIEHGYVGTVVRKSEYRDRYGRFLAMYIYFEDGRKINEANCRLV